MWLTQDSLDTAITSQVMDELKSSSPRTIGIVGGAFVDDHLNRLIESRLVAEPVKRGKVLREGMLRPGGPLGDFGNKIAVAYLMGIISKEAWKELDTIRSVRNEFAHRLHINSFEVDSIKDKCKNLMLWEQVKLRIVRQQDQAGPIKFHIAIDRVGDSEDTDGSEFKLFSEKFSDTPQGRYLASCKFYVAMFAILADLKFEIPKALI